MKSLLFILFTLVCATTAPAEEVAIGHLETNDDAGLNWLQPHCDRTGNQMRDHGNTIGQPMNKTVDISYRQAAADKHA